MAGIIEEGQQVHTESCLKGIDPKGLCKVRPSPLKLKLYLHSFIDRVLTWREETEIGI